MIGVEGRHLPPREVVELAGRLFADPRRHPRLIADEPLKKSVHRLRFDVVAGPDSVVVKRLSPRRAQVNQLVAERWLPTAGLAWACPRLRGVYHERRGSAVWHIYEDVAGTGLDGGAFDPARVEPVVELIADLHSRFAEHALLAECRERGGELGIGFFTVEVTRSLGFLMAIGSLGRGLTGEQEALRGRLLARVEDLYRERDGRALLLSTCGGPDTLLHGDLWTSNTLVIPRGKGFHASLIDWDHAGVGPVTYDLSTFLYRFAPEHRQWILGRYREAAARRGWRLPDDAILNLLFETAEYARYACCLAEAALAASRGERWAFEQLAEIDTWFDGLEPAREVARPRLGYASRRGSDSR
jgi:Phosphotransferase enzyme family